MDDSLVCPVCFGHNISIVSGTEYQQPCCYVCDDCDWQWLEGQEDNQEFASVN